jgi:type IV secretory pathway VirB10-like protein
LTAAAGRGEIHLLPKENFMPHLPRFLIATALLSSAGFAHAQYSWTGDNGVRQFSDRPPPPGTPAHKILKAPGRSGAALQAAAPSATPQPVAAGAAGSPAPGSKAGAAKGAPTLAQREAAYRERAAQRESEEKKEALEAQRQRGLAEHCEAARRIKAEAESGIRVAKFEANGERGFMTDEEKAAQAARANKVLADCR